MESKKEGVKKAQTLLERSRVLWMEDTIHDVPLQRPDDLAAAIADFVERDVEGG
jgi:hypothetical protein